MTAFLSASIRSRLRGIASGALCASFGVFSLAILLAVNTGVATADDAIQFNRDVRPILSNTCYKCHGPDENERQAGLRFDRKDSAFGDLESGNGHAVVAGDAAASELVRRITSTDEFERMPPVDSGKKLTPVQIDTLKRWVEQGAQWQGHWSFIPPERPEVPEVSDAAWARNPIDNFVLKRMQKVGLTPSPEADKVTLIRRVTFDLTGMPPTPAEIDAFLADDSPHAYETVVERLFKSPRYGEHMARYWLDLARYGDTHGLHFDNERSIWMYRNWVIDAFNRNKPFDKFTVEQLAGDLLPNATIEQRIATGFNRCNVSTNEGGSIDEEVRVRYAVDRVETTATVWLGLTAGCAVCHDHKYDPITQKEFYSLFAFFNSTADAAMDGNVSTPPPILKVPSEEFQEKMRRIDEQIAQARQKIADALAKVDYSEPPATTTAPSDEPQEYVWIDDAAPNGANLQGNSAWEFVTAPDHPVYSGQKSTRREAQGLSQHFFTGAGPGLKIGEGDKLFAYCYLDPNNPPKEVMLQFNDGSWEHRAIWGDDVIPWGQNGQPSRQPMGALPEAGKWVRLEVDAAKVGLPPGSVLNGWAFTQHDGLVYWDKAGIVTRTPQDGQSFKSLAAWEAYERAQSQSTAPQNVRDAVKVPTDQQNDEQKKLVRDYFLENVYGETRPLFDPLHQQIEALNKQRTDAEANVPTTLVMADMPQERETFVLIRGAYDKHGEKVTAGVPASLNPLPEGAPSNRLGLAEWIVDPANPLTARVAVNHFWQQFFGLGIVKTAEDFGSQGEWPTHPELLDWLAVEFRESSWDLRHILRLIVTSAAYRQSSRTTPELLERDPENIYLARGPRFRMDAEVVRDTVLAASGLLQEEIGGPSVKPYQPSGLWEAVGFLGSDTREFKRDTGEALYRRSMYTFWKRTSPPASLTAFDAPSREKCVARRSRTNTPLQALVLLNDEQYVEAARHLAERMMTEGGASPAERLSYGFRLATSRFPSDKELAVLASLLDQQLERFRADKEGAAALLKVGESPRNETLDASEQAAYTLAANVILNLDETITKE